MRTILRPTDGQGGSAFHPSTASAVASVLPSSATIRCRPRPDLAENSANRSSARALPCGGRAHDRTAPPGGRVRGRPCPRTAAGGPAPPGGLGARGGAECRPVGGGGGSAPLYGLPAGTVRPHPVGSELEQRCRVL